MESGMRREKKNTRSKTKADWKEAAAVGCDPFHKRESKVRPFLGEARHMESRADSEMGSQPLCLHEMLTSDQQESKGKKRKRMMNH